MKIRFGNYDSNQWKILSETDDLKQCIMLAEKSLKNEKAYFDKWIESKENGLSPEEKERFHEVFADEYWSINTVYPGIIRMSLFLTCYSMLEYNLNQLADLLKQNGGYKIKVTDLSGRGIERARNYIEKVANKMFPSDSNEWGKIKIYNEIRNCFVHNGGIVKPDSKSKIETYVNQATDRIKIDDFDRITIVSDLFCNEVVVTIKTFFEKLFSILREDGRGLGKI